MIKDKAMWGLLLQDRRRCGYSPQGACFPVRDRHILVITVNYRMWKDCWALGNGISPSKELGKTPDEEGGV